MNHAFDTKKTMYNCNVFKIIVKIVNLWLNDQYD